MGQNTFTIFHFSVLVHNYPFSEFNSPVLSRYQIVHFLYFCKTVLKFYYANRNWGGTVKALPSTKERFALALRELLESNSFESISVGDIVGLSGLSSRTFYNHFRDKNELLAYLYRITVEPLWYTDGKRNSLETFFTCCKDNFLYNGTLKGFGNALSYYGQNDLRSEIENKGVEDLVRLLKWNHFPGAITPELREVLRFFMCGITRYFEKYYLDSKTIQVDWLYTFWINCVPAYLAEYLVKEPE